MPQEAIVNYVEVPSIDEYVIKVEKLGGRIIVPKIAVPGCGYSAVCMDTENNTFGLWEVSKDAK